jgi:hypothetical protein
MAWRKFEDFSGQRFGRLLVIERVPAKPRKVNFLCQCDCGKTAIVDSHHLKIGKTKSCGCWNTDCRIKYDHSRLVRKTPEYIAYHSMIQRCYKEGSQNWPRYGARGIGVCERWRKGFEFFYADMGNRPSKKHSLDRIDNDGDYSPENCRWATSHVQMNNIRANHWLTCDGISLTIMQWSRVYGVAETTIHTRLRKGWPEEAAIKLPPDVRKKWSDRISELAQIKRPLMLSAPDKSRQDFTAATGPVEEGVSSGLVFSLPVESEHRRLA